MSWWDVEADGSLEQFLHRLGVDERFGFVDVYGLDDALLDMVPTPVYAVVVLFPITQKVGL